MNNIIENNKNNLGLHYPLYNAQHFYSPQEIIKDFLDAETISFLAHNKIEEAFEYAHVVLNVQRPLSKKDARGTNKKYETIVKRLANRDPLYEDIDPNDILARMSLEDDDDISKHQPSPYRGFRSLPEDTAKGTRYQYRAALLQHAFKCVEDTAASFQYKLLRDKENTEVLPILDGRMEGLGQGIVSLLSDNDICELAHAVRFIHENPPHVGTHEKLKARMQAGFKKFQSTKKKKASKPTPNKSKKHVLKNLALKEKRDKKKWRDVFFETAMNEQSSMNDDTAHNKRLTSAVLILTGCRPNEFVKGIRASLLPATPLDPEGRILFRITGSKLGTSDVEEHIFYEKLSDKDRELLHELNADEPTKAMLEKGQPYRYLEIGVQSDVGRWLMMYIIEHNDGVLDFDHYEMNEQMQTIKYTGQVSHSCELKPKGFSFVGSDTDLELEAKAVDALGQMIVRLGKKAFPKLRSNVSMYTFRHAFASDLKAFFSEKAGSYHADASAALGHQTTSTAQRYGSPAKGSKLKGQAIRETIVPIEIRDSYSADPSARTINDVTDTADRGML